MEKLGDIGEQEAIRRLTALLGTHKDLEVGAGDDCAVCSTPGEASDQVFTTDPVLEGIHFLSEERSERIGNKAAGRILSDLAAMGARPQWILVNVVAPPECSFERLEKIYEGMIAVCEGFHATIIGGDLAQGKALGLHLFGSGLVPKGTAVLRSGAGVGDSICVTGPLGNSRAGKHLDFTPRVNEGVFLRSSGLVTSMMDISDGLATDLRHVLNQSKVGACLDAEQIPLNGTVEQALYDGEDFELLFTVPISKEDALIKDWNKRFYAPLHKIGVISDQTGQLELTQQDGSVSLITTKAFEHFSPDKAS